MKNKPTNISLAEFIKHYLIINDMTALALAEKIEISTAQMSLAINGKRNLKQKSIEKLAVVCNADLDYLLALTGKIDEKVHSKMIDNLAYTKMVRSITLPKG
jgi:transcriptional regulator with XRE-family HTH domain